MLALAFLIVISLLLSAAMSALGKWWGPAFGEWEAVAHAVNLTASFGMLVAVFAAIYNGAFGSIVIVMVWVYYSAQIFLLGAEFTWAYARQSGSRQSRATGAEPRQPDIAPT